MIAYIKGILAEVTEENAVVDVNGVGCNIKISAATAKLLPGIGEEIKIHTYTLVREDAFLLYGFMSRDELELFKKCITVNGIGPKGALAILSVLDADSLRFAILSGDAKAIAKAPGIGGKTAERLIIDLKDKVSLSDTLTGRDILLQEQAGAAGMDTEAKKEAVEALTALGYGQTEALKAVNQVENAADLESGALLKAALKYLF